METIKRKNGNVSYRAKVYDGKKTYRKTFKRKTDAKKWKKNIEKRIDECEAKGVPFNLDMTFRDFSKEWINRKKVYGAQQRTIDAYQSPINKYLNPKLGDLILSEITVRDLDNIFIENPDLSPLRRNFIVRTIKMIFSDAEKKGFVLKNLFEDLKQVKVQEREPTYWPHHEVHKFLNANIESDLYGIYLLALNTGLRRGELLGLSWANVDLLNKRLIIRQIKDRYGLKMTTKTHQIRFVPINKVSYEYLLELKKLEINTEFVFTKKNGEEFNIRHISDRLFQKDIERAGVKRIRFHDLRTTYACNFMMSGGNIYDLSKILGHSSVDMTTKKYAFLSADYLQQASEIISFKATKPDDRPFLGHGKLRLVK